MVSVEIPLFKGAGQGAPVPLVPPAMGVGAWLHQQDRPWKRSIVVNLRYHHRAPETVLEVAELAMKALIPKTRPRGGAGDQQMAKIGH